MPCNSDHMQPRLWEIEASRLACLLEELDGNPNIDPSHWEGYHPDIYSPRYAQASKSIPSMTAELCRRLQSVDVTKCSLEMQIWWRDHQKADKDRLEKELKEHKLAKEKAKALSKLTPYERSLLGL